MKMRPNAIASASRHPLICACHHEAMIEPVRTDLQR
jgi:hypothetical protein